MKNTKNNISIEKLHPFENHPYKVQDNEEMEALAESISFTWNNLYRYSRERKYQYGYGT